MEAHQLDDVLSRFLHHALYHGTELGKTIENFYKLVQVCRSAGFLGSISILKAGKTENLPCSVLRASSTFEMVRVLLVVFVLLV